MHRKDNALCRLHTLKAVQIGSCITCSSASPICETKGCIKHHLESEKMHTSYSIKDVHKIIQDFINANEQKRAILKKHVVEYFQLLKSEIESLFHEVTHALDNLKFENFLMDDNQRKLADLLVMKRYSDLSCADVARVIPKMVKCASFEEKQFHHLRDFLLAERDNLPKTVNSMVLNLPYFREDQRLIAIEKYSEVSDQLLSNVNKKIEALTYRPKKLRIKYGMNLFIQSKTKAQNLKVIKYQYRSTVKYIKEKFIKLLENSHSLKEVELLEFYCVWDIKEEDFQIEFMDAVLSYPFLTGLTLYTGYKVTSTAFIEEMIENKNIELKIYKKDWHF